MDPITILAVTQGVGALAQYFQGEKARGASKDELNKIRAVFDQIKPPDLNLNIESPPEELARLAPVPYGAQSQVNPTNVAFQAPPEAQLIQETADGRRGLDAQRSALRQLQDRALSGRNPEVDATLNKGARLAGQQAHSRASELEDQFAQRGLLNSGIRAGAQQRSNSDALQIQAQAGESGAALSYKAKLEALQQQALAGNNLRGQDIGLQGMNADIINKLNATTTKQHQDIALQNALNSMNADRFNATNANTVANANVDTQNDFRLKNRDYAMNAWKAKAEALKYGNDARLGAYNAAIAKAQGQMGFYNAGNQLRGSQADATQGLFNTGISAAKGYYDNQREDAKQDREDDRAEYRYTGKWRKREEDK